MVPSLKLTAKAPENRPSQKETRKSSHHPFLGAKMLVSGRVNSEYPTKWKQIPKFKKHHGNLRGLLGGWAPRAWFSGS